MKKVLVVYSSVYGSTKAYAQEIAKQADADLVDFKTTKNIDVSPYEVIVYGGGLYAGGIKGIDFIKQNKVALNEKCVIVFTCGASNPAIEENRSTIQASLKKALEGCQFANFHHFLLRGNLNYEIMGPVHKVMMKMMMKMIKKKKPEEWTAEDIGFMESYGQKADFIDFTSLKELLACIQSRGEGN